ncbi:Fatty acid desaturase 3 [Symbiodinium microadriaticum]|uniref:Fatty acid desaturase 3 n=1 Tax=Symbiodinium microadriaticum TaxID=2951 RepID=A0A1Q9D9H2_SYMMI|nr:Fatty acid desaturase 3 [Symbiodinium microadriaticum]
MLGPWAESERAGTVEMFPVLLWKIGVLPYDDPAFSGIRWSGDDDILGAPIFQKVRPPASLLKLRGPLIRRAIGEDATDLFLSHHAPSSRAAEVLRRCRIGSLEGHAPIEISELWRTRPLQKLIWERLCSAQIDLRAKKPLAEGLAFLMLFAFLLWAWLCYVCGWWRLDVAFAWFWWRHLDAGLHASMHGDFRHSRWTQKVLRRLYGMLSHRALEYYCGAHELKGMGMSKHWWHHVFPNDPGRDPDWSTMTGVAWVRRHRSAQWHPCHLWQCWYWLPIATLVEPLLELLQVACSAMEALAALLEPPMAGDFAPRAAHAAGLWLEIFVNPGFQLAAFCAQPFWKALRTLILARAVSRLVLYPFSEVQHYMPEHIDLQDKGEEWVVGQLRRTANLRFLSWPAWLLDFLMFHGDSHQIEHHLWPAMSFVQYSRASRVVRAACADLGLPYHSVGYWDGYRKILGQAAEAMPIRCGGISGGPWKGRGGVISGRSSRRVPAQDSTKDGCELQCL